MSRNPKQSRKTTRAEWFAHVEGEADIHRWATRWLAWRRRHACTSGCCCGCLRKSLACKRKCATNAGWTMMLWWIWGRLRAGETMF